MVICDYSQISSDFRIVDTFKRENESKEYTNLNPGMSIPMITEGNKTIIGDGKAYYYHLVNKHSKVKEALYPTGSELHVKSMMEWFQNVMRPKTFKLIRVKINRNAKKKEKEVGEMLDEYFGLVLKTLENRLSAGQSFTCGQAMTLIDIIFYCDIVTVLKLYQKELPKDSLECVSLWFSKIG